MKGKKRHWLASAVAGGAAGLANGFFGGGGGMILVPLLVSRCGLSQRKAFATSVAVILPLCVLSVVIYWLRGELDFTAALPYLLGFAAGAMMYVVVEELIPEMSEGEHSNIGTLCFALGFTAMIILDVLLG